MFRQSEAFSGGWKDKTIHAMHKRRFDLMVAQLPSLGVDRLENLSLSALWRRLERCWQGVERKPTRKQQVVAVRTAVLNNIEIQADCLSRDEHELVERALILGGCIQINDIPELEAAHTLALRLWGHVGLISERPFLELDSAFSRPIAKAFARDAHEEMRRRFDAFYESISGLLYQMGAIDDRQPQKIILRDILGGAQDDALSQLARHFLWASFDCIDYESGVLLVHRALADPKGQTLDMRRRIGVSSSYDSEQFAMDILPEEIPLQTALERAISSALRKDESAHDVARTLRYLCKQGAPLKAMEEVLQHALIVSVSPVMRSALEKMYYTIPKWTESSEHDLLQ